jgi:outer membrane protein assembly factor BamD (BamD/ComL family)
MRKVIAGLLGAGLLAVGVAAHAGDIKMADELYSQAVAAKKAGRYADALSKYAASRSNLENSDTMRMVRVFWGVGTTYELMRDCPNAITTWEEYIRFADGKQGEAAGVKNARQKIDVCKKILEMRP